jgi:hypothetical protein
MNSLKKSLGWLNIALLCLAGLLVLYVIFRFIKKTIAQPPEELPEPDDISPDILVRHYGLIRQVLAQEGVDEVDQLAQLYTAQAAFETGNFSSKVYKRNNNLFGMRQAIKRYTTSVGDIDEDGYANYVTVQESVLDRLEWDRFNKMSYAGSVEQFVQAIYNKGYFEAPLNDYTKGVQLYFSKLLSAL